MSSLFEQMNYQVREREEMIYAADADNISHIGDAGDIDSGKAWRTVRRPSDMVIQSH